MVDTKKHIRDSYLKFGLVLICILSLSISIYIFLEHKNIKQTISDLQKDKVSSLGSNTQSGSDYDKRRIKSPQISSIIPASLDLKIKNNNKKNKLVLVINGDTITVSKFIKESGLTLDSSFIRLTTSPLDTIQNKKSKIHESKREGSYTFLCYLNTSESGDYKEEGLLQKAFINQNFFSQSNKVKINDGSRILNLTKKERESIQYDNKPIEFLVFSIDEIENVR